jgi:hypothetical protein
MLAIGFPRDLHPVGYWGAHRTMEQIARAISDGKDPAIELLDEDDDLPIIDADTARARSDALARHAEAFMRERQSGTIRSGPGGVLGRVSLPRAVIRARRCAAVRGGRSGWSPRVQAAFH